MKKTVLLLAAFAALCVAGQAQAATTPASPKPPSAQQSRMKSCAADYHKKSIPKSQYKGFMSACLKSKPMGTGAGTGAGSKGAPEVK